MSADPKTPEQLESEIAYFRREIERNMSADRVRRAHLAILTREQQLTVARSVRSRLGSGPAPEPLDNALQRVGGGDRR